MGSRCRTEAAEVSPGRLQAWLSPPKSFLVGMPASQPVGIVRSSVFPRAGGGGSSLLQEELNRYHNKDLDWRLSLTFTIYVASTRIHFLNGHK